MKAAVLHGPGYVQYDTVDDPKLKEKDDVILKVTSTAIVVLIFIFHMDRKDRIK
jgi:threonine dehydrogenase-like Zn-dependent dehydrogenase